MYSLVRKRTQRILEHIRLASGSRVGLSAMLCLHIVACCVSLYFVAHRQPHMSYDAAGLYYAIVAVVAFSTLSLLLVVARFSFGYVIGFNLFTMVLGYIWLSNFSRFDYDHRLAAFSAAVSALLFLVPALFVNAPATPVFSLSSRAFERLLMCVLVLSAGTIASASFYNFRLVSVGRIYDFREGLSFPGPLRYLIGIVSTVLLPFAFAGYLAIERRWWAAAAVILLLFFYPITLSKFALFAPIWVIVMVVLSRMFEPRAATILAVLLPMLSGIILAAWSTQGFSEFYFDLVNVRMMATPAGAMDVYNDFFAIHPPTWFCQISFLKPLMSCPYQEPLSVVMEQAYRLGNLNASLFATEGIASVGLYLAPLVALFCGLILSLGNRASAGLPSSFILVSSALLPQAFLNVPFTTVLLTHGAGFLFLLWYSVPRTIFDRKFGAMAP